MEKAVSLNEEDGMEYITREDLRVINSALQRGDVVRIKHTREGGTKITRESSRLLKSKPIRERED